jgi:hypothetical protein
MKKLLRLWGALILAEANLGMLAPKDAFWIPKLRK